MNARIETSLAARAYSLLKAAIFEGRLPPGAPLSRRRLAEEFGMSPVPVGAAILRLENEGLIETRARAGARVRIATPGEIHGNYVLREALETHSARLFAGQATAAQRERLLKLAARLDATNWARAARAESMHVAFHMLIARTSKIPALIEAIERSRVLLFNWLFTVSLEATRLPDRWHSDLARVLAESSPADAAEAMRTHVRFRQDEVIERFRSIVKERSTRMVRGPQRRTLAAQEAAVANHRS